MGNFALGVIAGLVISILGEVARRAMWGPRLCLEFQRGPEFIVETVETMELVPARSIESTPEKFLAVQSGCAEGLRLYQHHRANYVRLKAINGGHDVAKNCYGYLVNVEKWDGNSFTSIGFHDTIPLCWSYLNQNAPQRIDIVKGVPQYLDIFSTLEGRNTVTPRVAIMPNCYQEFFEEFRDGRLRFSVVVAAEGAEHKRETVELRWNGDWQHFDVDCTSLEEFNR